MPFPAKVAGCARVVMVVPAPDGVLSPLVLVAAELAGVDEIYRVGGAQAIAALAYGTETIAPVAKIVGPGNAYVAAAKRRVFGTVGIDMIAGPSEVVILADGTANPDWIAADLLAQAEHDMAAQSILITTDEGVAEAVARGGGEPAPDIAATRHRRGQLAGFRRRHPRAQPRGPRFRSWTGLRPSTSRSSAQRREALADTIRNAGAIFLGGHTPEAIGDYVGGSNHVLPTARSARFSSGLGVLDFMKRTSLLRCNAAALAALGPAAITLGRGGRAGRARPLGLDPRETAGRRDLRAVRAEPAGVRDARRGVDRLRHRRSGARAPHRHLRSRGGEQFRRSPDTSAAPIASSSRCTSAKLALDVRTETGEPVMVHLLVLAAFPPSSSMIM